MIRIFLTIISRVTLLILLLIPVSETPAQIIRNGNDDVYGFDPMLYNGRYYTFFSPLNARGNQYLNNRGFESGTVTLRGVTYTDILLNYDIFNQQLLLEYSAAPGISQVIILSDAWIEKFSIKDRNFAVIKVAENEKHFFQEIGKGQFRILYFWKKHMHLESVVGGTRMTFSKPLREMNLFTEGKIVRYQDNKSFSNLFRPGNKEKLREYIRDHRINVKKASDKVMEDLINYCITLEEK